MAATESNHRDDLSMLRDAYVYLLSRALVNRQEIRDLAEPGVEYNKFKHNPIDQVIDWANPNLDVANSETWVAVDADHPVRLVIPTIEGRYFTVQVIDQWGETITNINPRKFPLGASGEFFFVAPDNRASLPNDSSVIVLRSRKAKILARIEIADDAETATELQRQLQLDAAENTDILPPISVPDFGNDTLLGIEIFDHAEDLVAGIPDVAPRAAELQVLVQHMADRARGESWRQGAEQSLRNEIIPAFLQFAMTEAGVVQNGWFGTIVIGVYGEHVDIRTAANLIGIWANVSSEVIYFVATRDSAGEPFDGNATYLLDFAPDTQPQHVVLVVEPG